MIVLTIRTDKPDAELGLFEGDQLIDYREWQADRRLAETIHATIRDLLEKNGMSMASLGGIFCYAGPGSFTGLRIGLTVANALGEALAIPVRGSTGEDWQAHRQSSMEDVTALPFVLPEYGAPVNITLPKK